MEALVYKNVLEVRAIAINQGEVSSEHCSIPDAESVFRARMSVLVLCVAIRLIDMFFCNDDNGFCAQLVPRRSCSLTARSFSFASAPSVKVILHSPRFHAPHGRLVGRARDRQGATLSVRDRLRPPQQVHVEMWHISAMEWAMERMTERVGP